MTTKTRKARTTLTIEQALATLTEYSVTDLEMLTALVGESGATKAFVPPAALYVAFTDKHGKTLIRAHKGYLTVLSCAPVTIDLDPTIGRPMVSTANGRKGHDLYLSGWEGPAPHEAGSTRVPGGRPKVTTPTRQTCLEEDCKIWVPGGGMCGKHQRALAAMLAAL